MTRRILFTLLLVLLAPLALAHVGDHPSVHDVVSGVLDRMRTTLDTDTVSAFTAAQAEAFLTPDERHVLGSEYLTFHLSVPAMVTVLRDVRLGEEPFWLRESGFAPTGVEAKIGGRVFDAWQKVYPAGPGGLGVNSLSGSGDHYVALFRPIEEGTALEITSVYPGFHTLGRCETGQPAYVDDDTLIEEVPADLSGQTMLLGAKERRADAQMVGVFRVTQHPAGAQPDNVILTWSDDPRTTQTIQWRTGPQTNTGYLAYQKKDDANPFGQRTPAVVRAETEVVDTPDILNDPVNHRHVAVLRELEPATTYVYAVSSSSDCDWSELAEFTTAPEGTEPFSFIYMGDAQNGLERWGSLVRNSFLRRPESAFYVMAGDLVNRGNDRNEWDELFHEARDVYDRRPVVPALGNHEYHGGEPELYLKMFTLPEHGPEGIQPEKAYTLRYSNALFVVLDSNLPPESQAVWLEEQLATTDAKWKFVVYHHPAYSSSPTRDNPEVRQVWGDIFDRQRVDMALQGHDHAYLRTKPMKAGQPVASPSEGTVYIVSVSGIKFYEVGEFDYTAFSMANTPTYQVLDIQVQGDRLVYRAYDIDGNLRDELVIEK